jgi:hypothetical protein
MSGSSSTRAAVGRIEGEEVADDAARVLSRCSARLLKPSTYQSQRHAGDHLVLRLLVIALNLRLEFWPVFALGADALVFALASPQLGVPTSLGKTSWVTIVGDVIARW